MGNEVDVSAICRRLDVMILLLLETSPRAAKSVASKIELLLEMGLSNSEVARILGKDSNYVRATVSNAKKREGRSGSKAKEVLNAK